MSIEVNESDGQKAIYGQDLEVMLPLALVAEGIASSGQTELTKTADSPIEAAFKTWLQTDDLRELSRKICFLDITFGPVREHLRNSMLQTITIASSQFALDAYRNVVLKKLFDERKFSLAAHHVFRQGIPIFVEKTNIDGKTTSRSFRPETEDEMNLYFSRLHRKYELCDDGFLHSHFDARGCPEECQQPSVPAFETSLFSTFGDDPFSSQLSPSGVALSHIWDVFTQLLEENKSQLPSNTGHSLGEAFALPLGVRDPGNPRRFSWIADVYVGFDCLTDTAEARRFIRHLFLYLMRTNAALRTREDTLHYLLRTFGHEVKRITGMLSESWIVPADELLSISSNESPQGASQSQNREFIGELKLHDKYAHLLKEGPLLIAPFGRFVRAAQQTVDLWAWQNGKYDMPAGIDQPGGTSTPIGRMPRTWEQLLGHTWELARDQVVMRRLSGGAVFTPKQIDTANEDMEKHLLSFQEQRPKLLNEKLPPAMQGDVFLWASKESSQDKLIDASFSVARALISWFANCVQHGDAKKAIEVEVEQRNVGENESSRGEFVLRIRNAVAPPKHTEGKQSSQGNSSKSKMTSSIQSVRVALEEIDGEVLRHGRSADGTAYEFECSFFWDLEKASSKKAEIFL